MLLCELFVKWNKWKASSEVIGWEDWVKEWKDAREESREDKTWNKWNDASERTPSKKRQMPKRQKSVFAHAWKLKSAALQHHFFASHISLQHCKNQYIFNACIHIPSTRGEISKFINWHTRIKACQTEPPV
jgi:hypothetical protein